MAAGISDALWSVTDMAEMIDATLPKPGQRGPYKRPGGVMMWRRLQALGLTCLAIVVLTHGCRTMAYPFRYGVGPAAQSRSLSGLSECRSGLSIADSRTCWLGHRRPEKFKLRHCPNSRCSRLHLRSNWTTKVPLNLRYTTTVAS